MTVLIGAYGRVYMKKADVIEDYVKGKDFTGDISMGFRLCSRRDLKNQRVELRYGRYNDKCVIFSPEDDE